MLAQNVTESGVAARIAFTLARWADKGSPVAQGDVDGFSKAVARWLKDNELGANSVVVDFALRPEYKLQLCLLGYRVEDTADLVIEDNGACRIEYRHVD